MTSYRAVIIAGGAGDRLGGVRKADLRIGGVRQVDRVLSVLGRAESSVMISTGPLDRRIAIPDGCIGVSDLDAGCAGPLAGLAAAVDRLGRDGVGRGLLVSVVVDSPFLPADFCARMIAGIGDAPAAYAGWGDDFYPPNAIWRIESLQDLPGHIRAGTAPGSLKALQRALGAARVAWPSDEASPFLNINTVADLIAAQRIAQV